MLHLKIVVNFIFQKTILNDKKIFFIGNIFILHIQKPRIYFLYFKLLKSSGNKLLILNIHFDDIYISQKSINYFMKLLKLDSMDIIGYESNTYKF